MKKKRIVLHDIPGTMCYSLHEQIKHNRRNMGLNAHDIAAKLKVPLSTVLTHFDIMDGKEPKAY